jgi:hypothetical protein
MGDLVFMLQGMGIKTGVNLTRLIEISRWFEAARASLACNAAEGRPMLESPAAAGVKHRLGAPGHRDT